jgi:PKD repeat protein
VFAGADSAGREPLGSGGYTYLWDFGDATSSTLADPTHTYAADGSYVVTVTVTDSFGCVSPAIGVAGNPVVVYGPTAAPVVDANPACLGTAQTFTANASLGSGVYTYLWNFGNGDTSTAANPVYTYPARGSYTVTVTVTCSFGCLSGPIGVVTNPVEVNGPDAAPTVDAEPVCLETQQTFMANASLGQPPYTYLWNFGNGDTSTAANPLYEYPADGSYTVTVTVTDSFGCVYGPVALASGPVDVYGPTAAPTVVANPECLGTAQQFTANASLGSGGYTYVWNFGNGDTSTAANPVYTYPANGSYTVTVTVTDSFGCVSPAIGVAGNPVLVYGPTAAPVVDANPVCQGTPQTFTANASLGLAPYTYLWDFGDATRRICGTSGMQRARRWRIQRTRMRLTAVT